MTTLVDYAKAQGAKSMQKITGPNGAFISLTTEIDKMIAHTKEDKKAFTIPVGRKSQAGKLGEYNVLITSDGQAIATVNQYSAEESMDL